MAAAHDAEAVRATLRILGEAGRSDHLRPGVLDKDQVGMQRAICAATHGVAAAIAAWRSPARGEKEMKGWPKIVGGALGEPDARQEQVGRGNQMRQLWRHLSPVHRACL
ncbi:hypothetical protein NDU88_003743 [Pleurodeles waltl]|uniref:Uncharacterized protein n=1 Tax=Pleurodeles waltl TaxID=8319 RepID=A0AAV7W389_PLEWA|nr:hypothetical protein NDU88_003743 [Pleurodeles waltl]